MRTALLLECRLARELQLRGPPTAEPKQRNIGMEELGPALQSVRQPGSMEEEEQKQAGPDTSEASRHISASGSASPRGRRAFDARSADITHRQGKLRGCIRGWRSSPATAQSSYHASRRYLLISPQPEVEGRRLFLPALRHSSPPVPSITMQGPASAPCPPAALALLGEHSQPGSRASAYGGQTEGATLRCDGPPLPPPAAAQLLGCGMEPTPGELDMRYAERVNRCTVAATINSTEGRENGLVIRDRMYSYYSGPVGAPEPGPLQLGPLSTSRGASNRLKVAHEGWRKPVERSPGERKILCPLPLHAFPHIHPHRSSTSGLLLGPAAGSTRADAWRMDSSKKGHGTSRFKFSVSAPKDTDV
ncbi:hypothetical protein P4O66_022445 [Electrophorus voltai]|uniref:Uncharacterized protein n=1 Tax=Electrophorus voltai TaxID=2609070 RepID=A0AAD8ZN19_9TELE|nr:hypothetical protein P4O66_022445 [Electrophorus voltai]